MLRKNAFFPKLPFVRKMIVFLALLSMTQPVENFMSLILLHNPVQSMEMLHKAIHHPSYDQY